MENLGLNPAFWTGRRVLLTGHTGFKGSWLLLLLNELGAEVTGVSLAAPAGSLFTQIDGADRCAHHVADIRDAVAMRSLMAETQPDVVLHLAAQPLVRQSYVDPLETIGTNVLGTATVLDAARSVEGLLALVSVTTDKCYANDGRASGYREADRLGGHDPYSNSKACAELVTQCFRDSFFAPFGIGVASARAGNVIGGGDYAVDRLVPDIVRSLTSGRNPELRNPAALRPWQHVLEPLTGYCLLAQLLAGDPIRYAKGWNFGPPAQDVATVGTVAQRLARHWPQAPEFCRQGGVHPHEAQVLTLDSTLAARELAWSPRLTLNEAIDWTAEWYLAQHAGSAAAELCLAQIGRYASHLGAQAAAA